jgi:drug/metabolite transporter (DMT)-like permease
MLILGVIFERPAYGSISVEGLGCFAYMTLVPMGVCYLTWFETLRRLPPVTASTGLLLVPVLAMIAASFVLGEPLGIRETAAIVLTLSGVALALRRSS